MWMAALTAEDVDTTLDTLLPDELLALDVGDTTGSSTDSGAETRVEREVVAAEEQPVSKKRKATYYVRKDAIESLQDQVKALEEQLARARSTSAATLREAQLRSVQYEQDIERNNLTLAGSESMLSAYKLAMAPTSTIPLKTYIRMPLEPEARQELLQALWRPKLDAALRFMTERMRFLDMRYEHKSEEAFRQPNGDVISIGCDVTPFTSGHNVKQVFDAFKTFILSQEISISERLGVLTIRENEDIEGFLYGQSRYLSATPVGVNIESNSAMFATYVEANPAEGTPAYAVGAMDFVDQDDLYPYRPETCGRKEMTTALTITETTSETGGRVVSLCKWGYIRLRLPLCPLSEDEASSVRESMSGLSSVMNKVMRERLATEAPLA